MNAKEFRKYLDRDGGCVHCGETEAVAPNHRANRGMGGSKERNVPSNIVVMCSRMNGLIESDTHAALLALGKGWKVRSYDWPAAIPVWDARDGRWYRLNDDYTREETQWP